ncbi:MAG TPA: TRAP transporter large permease [Alphaproteobacteria bacterium]|nr:TRAP transporter large permease [Alphaproteobacteria bacterium]
MTAFLVVGLLVLLVLNVPIAFAMLLTSILYLLIQGDVPLVVVAQRVVAGTDQYLLLAIPFFFLAAELMNSGGIMQQLVRVAMAMVGHFRGGLGHVSVVANILLSGISGSAAADAAGLGKLQVEMMKRGGYDVGFAAALGAAAATIGPVFPPSIPFVVYGGIAGVSVGALFLAGIVPGLLMGAFLMAAVWVIARRRNYPLQPWSGFRSMAVETWRATPILVLPIIILGGILSGAFTPTEAAVVAAAYAFLVGKFLLRTLRWGDLYGILVKVGSDSANLMFIIAASALYAWILARENVPQELAAAMLSVSTEPWVVLLLINIVLLILGTALEPVVILVLVVPIFDPLIKTLGIDPIHFGVVVTLNLMIGLLTPPMGSVIFIMMAIANISMEKFMRECWPFMAVLTLLLLIITYIPWLVLVVPNLYYGGGGG